MTNDPVVIGYDVGSSSIKASVISAESGALIASATSPSQELAISAPQAGWAEQHPDLWWEHVVNATAMLHEKAALKQREILGIGISYQMHGLVIVDKDLKPLRPSIIWCDSRAVAIGERAFRDLGSSFCLERYLNSPGNFTAAKLAWVRENEPKIFEKARSLLLPGDYIALKMSGALTTTASGLSEGIMWDMQDEKIAAHLLAYFKIPESLVPQIVPTFGTQAELSGSAAQELGLPVGTKIAYRAGDQPNNALSLNVLQPGEVAATAGTSGVVYGVGDVPHFDSASRVNTFLHVNHSKVLPRYGTLLCVNGTGSMNRWLRGVLSQDGTPVAYRTLDGEAAKVAAGSDGVTIFPYGNGAERSLNNRNLGASIQGLQLNSHTRAHLARAVQEGIVFALNYGLEIFREMSIPVHTVRAGLANMFVSPVFREIFSSTTNTTVELFETDGAQGAARGAAIGAKAVGSVADAFRGLTLRERIEPNKNLVSQYGDLYGAWQKKLSTLLRQEVN